MSPAWSNPIRVSVSRFSPGLDRRTWISARPVSSPTGAVRAMSSNRSVRRAASPAVADRHERLLIGTEQYRVRAARAWLALWGDDGGRVAAGAGCGNHAC